MEGTRCVDTASSDVLKLLSFLPDYSSLQVPLARPSLVHLQEGESIGRTVFNNVFIFRGRDVQFVCSYFRCELKVLVLC